MIERPESVRNANIILHLDHAAVIEFDDLAAGCANEMVMVRAVNGFFILRMSLRKPVAGNQAAFMQKIQRLIDGGARNFRAVIFQRDKKIIGVEMIVPFHYGFEDFESFGCDPIFAIFQEFPEYLGRRQLRLGCSVNFL